MFWFFRISININLHELDEVFSAVQVFGYWWTSVLGSLGEVPSLQEPFVFVFFLLLFLCSLLFQLF